LRALPVSPRTAALMSRAASASTSPWNATLPRYHALALELVRPDAASQRCASSTNTVGDCASRDISRWFIVASPQAAPPGRVSIMPSPRWCGGRVHVGTNPNR
jgi:hypothetical protein